jgi:MtN3 and saliva related transmembrane protein
MNATDLGLVAGALTTAAWLPQIVRICRLRRAEEISWSYLVIFGLGISCWLAYGLIRSDLAIIWANAVTLVLLISIVALKFFTRDARRENEAP